MDYYDASSIISLGDDNDLNLHSVSF